MGEEAGEEGWLLRSVRVSTNTQHRKAGRPTVMYQGLYTTAPRN